jgi:pimeloyl-ACP methyl ester carboxylesterase
MTDAATEGLPTFKNPEGKARYLAAYDAVLADWPVAYEERDVPTRLGPTHVIASGPADEPPLILLPSFAASATVWRPNVEALSRRYRTYAIDVIGQPGKSHARRMIADRQDYADWLAEVLDGLGVRRASIVGCSFGGFLALSQASLTPERVGKVVLISPAGTFVALSWKFFYAMRIRGPVLRLLRRLTGSKRAPSLADLRGDRVPLDPRDAKWRALMGVTMAEAPKVSITNASVFSRAELRAIRAPTLLLIGEKETLYEPAPTLKLAMKRMPGLTGAVVPGADHIAAMARPDEVNDRILRFLGSEAQPGADEAGNERGLER